MSSDHPRVFIVQAVPGDAVAELSRVASVSMFTGQDRTISRDELIAGVTGTDYLWAFGEIPVDGEVMDRGPLRMIAIMEILSRAVDIDAATQRGIPVTTLPNLEIITTSTAELAFTLIQALARRIPEADRSIRESRWVQYQAMEPLGMLLEGKLFGIVGLGNVGRKLARRALAANMEVVYTDRVRLDPETERTHGVRWLDLDDLLEQADIVALTPTLTTSSLRLIDAARLARMKPTALLVNTSRGPVVDEAALVDALAAGRIAGAALDVFETEPPTPSGGPRSELRAMDNVILTPHLGTATREARLEMARTVVAGLVAAIAGDRPPYVINPEVYGEAAVPRLDRLG